MKKGFLTLSLIYLFVSSASAQQAGAGISSNVSTGYGLYAVTMRASSSPGAISSFYTYDQNATYPARWHEIDIEFSPGFTGIGKTRDPNHPHSLAKGQCYNSTTSDALPMPADCQVQAFLTGTAGSDLSFNTYNIRGIDGEPYTHSNDQVFMPSNSGNDVFNNYHTYYFYYTPLGVYWTRDNPGIALTVTPPTTLPTPVFVKRDFNVVANNPTWNPANNNDYQAFWYDKLPLTPINLAGKPAQTGTLMAMSMNLWDGTNTDPTHQQDWGGEHSPPVGASSSYLYVAYYPLITPVANVGKNPALLQYGKAALYSDFTTTEGRFLINNKASTFTAMWHIYNNSYLYPIGQLDERNIACGSGSLTLKISNTYSQPRNNYDKLTDCPWLNQN